MRASLSQAFSLVAKAERSGGDVSGLVARLNEAAGLVNSGDSAGLAKASGIIGEVRASVAGVEAAGVSAVTYQYIVVGLTLVVLAALGLLVILYGSRLYWMLWLRARGGLRVVAS